MSFFIRLTFLFVFLLYINNIFAQRHIEQLDRGLVAVQITNGVFLSWRVFGTDSEDVAFNIYRNGNLITTNPVTGATNMVDTQGGTGSTYTVRAIINGQEQPVGASASVWNSQVLTLDVQRPAGGTTPDGVDYSYEPNDINIGDLDGDGQYELVVKWYPSNAKDNSQSGYTGTCFLDAYKLNGAFMWRIDLGINIRSGAHYTQHLVADYDMDGFAEVVCKTAPGTKDGMNTFLSDGPAASDNDQADYRNSGGYILDGPEYLTIFNGLTGAEMATINYVPQRGNVGSWGDTYGNRLDRYNSTNAYLDGNRPSMVFQRGYYTRMVIAAFNWDGQSLSNIWTFDSNNPGCGAAYGNGNHSIMAADGDGDGFDEIYTGATAIDHDGSFMWCTGHGHGDANHIGDLDPDRPGIEIWQVSEWTGNEPDHYMIDAATGNIIWGDGSGHDNGRGMCGDIDASTYGQEAWSNSIGGTYSCTGNYVSGSKGSSNFRVYWDGDLQDELLDGNRIDKWNGNGTTRLKTLDGWSCNGSKSTPNLSADIIGDWREEVILHYESSLLITTTTILTEHKLYTLMHDPTYRNAISWQQSAYNQPPHLGFFLGDGVENAPTPNITMVGAVTTDCNGMDGGTAYIDDCGNCVSGNTGLEPCIVDCHGDENGSAYIDDCGTCVAGNTGLQECVTVSVTYTVDMTGADVSNGVYITGDFTSDGQNWSIVEMNDNGDNTYSAEFAMISGNEGGFYFLNGNNWQARETVPIECIEMYDSDRGYHIGRTDTTVYTVWSSCEQNVDCNGTPNGTAYYDDCETCVAGTTGFEPCSPQGIQLYSGWNLIGYPLFGSANIEDALSSIWANVQVVKDMEQFYSVDQPDFINTLTDLYWGEGYLIKVSEDCILIW